MFDDPRKVYGQHEVSTISAEEAMVRLHEKLLERIEKVRKLSKEIKDFPAKKLAEEIDMFNSLLNERGKEIDLIINTIDAIKQLISDETPSNLKEQIYLTYNALKVNFLRGILQEKDEYFEDVITSVKTLLDGWKEALLKKKED
jgi:flagellin-specific chaperone FliS